MTCSYCDAQQQPKKPGNLLVKKKATHIISPAPGASKVTKLASGDHFVYCKLLSYHKRQSLTRSLWSGTNSHTVE